MADEKNTAKGLEWRVTIPEGSSAKLESETTAGAWLWSKTLELVKNIWKMGVDDPRRVIHCIKVGIAMTLVSLFYYTRPLYDGVGGAAMWAIMTVVVVFEYTVGGSFYKGVNRAMATFSAGAIAVGVHWIASKLGDKMEPVFLGASVFILASAATFSRFIPTIKARFDYGVSIFILTFSLVAVSGYRVDQLLELAEQRLSTVAIGISICLIVCLLICPVWAGEDLRLLITRNMEKLADSIEGCVNEYFEGDAVDAEKETTSEQSQGYECVLNSKASEDSLANLAIWEPPHGCISFKHPWNQYLKVGAAMRYCACCMEALNGCSHLDAQMPESLKKRLRDCCTKLSLKSSIVLKEAMECIKSMRWSSATMDLLVGEMNIAAKELQKALGSLPTQTTQPPSAPTATSTRLPLMQAMPLITFATLLMETSARVEGVVNAANQLADMACFKQENTDIDESETIKNNPLQEQQIN